MADRNKQLGHDGGRASMVVFNSYEVTEAGEQYSESLKALMLPVIDSFSQSTISNADEPLTNQGKAKENTYYQCFQIYYPTAETGIISKVQRTTNILECLELSIPSDWAMCQIFLLCFSMSQKTNTSFLMTFNLAKVN